MYNLFLDDDRSRSPAKVSGWMPEKVMPLYHDYIWYRVYNYEEFVKAIEEKGLPAMVSFDHDLAHEHYVTEGEPYDEYKEKTGYHAMQWMIDYIIEHSSKPPKVLVHSLNPVGRDNIANLFDNFLKFYKWQPSKE